MLKRVFHMEGVDRLEPKLSIDNISSKDLINLHLHHMLIVKGIRYSKANCQLLVKTT